MSPRDGFTEAVKAAQGVSALAKALGESVQTVSNWAGRGVPPNKCKAVEAVTGVSVRSLRPDDWQDYWPDAPAPQSGAQERASAVGRRRDDAHPPEQGTRSVALPEWQSRVLVDRGPDRRKGLFTPHRITTTDGNEEKRSGTDRRNPNGRAR